MYIHTYKNYNKCIPSTTINILIFLKIYKNSIFKVNIIYVECVFKH